LKSQNGLNFSGNSSSTTTYSANVVVSNKGTFGVPLFAASKATTAGTLSTATTQTGFNTMGTPRTPQYYTTIDFEMAPRMPVAQKLDILQSSLQNSGSIKGARNLVVTVENQTVVLGGTVATERDRRLAEALVRMEPGVRDVRNEILVTGGN